MPIRSYEVRVCNSCGLRYPLLENHAFGTRCPVCMGDTRAVLERQLITELGISYRGIVEGGKRMAVLLDNIRSAWNVGSILRSADGFGFTHAYVCGITPTPDQEAVNKTSLGAEESVTWSYHKNAVDLVAGLKVQGWKVYGLEEDARAVELGLSQNLAYEGKKEVLIVGNEVTGVDPELLDLCDQIYYIPMHGEKKSFNVAIAFGIAAYSLSTQQVG